MRKTLFAVAAAAALLSGYSAIAQTAAPAAAAASTATISIHLRGLTAHKGAVAVLLFDSSDNYDAGKAVQSTKVDADSASIDLSFTDVAPGRYAIKAFYDMDGNGKYDPGNDSIGFSNHVIMDSPSHVPSYSETSFIVKSGANSQQITVNQVRA